MVPCNPVKCWVSTQSMFLCHIHVCNAVHLQQLSLDDPISPVLMSPITQVPALFHNKVPGYCIKQLSMVHTCLCCCTYTANGAWRPVVRTAKHFLQSQTSLCVTYESVILNMYSKMRLGDLVQCPVTTKACFCGANMFGMLRK